MKKLITLIIVTFFATTSLLYASGYLGTYTTKPEIVPGFEKPYPDVVKKAIDRMTWKMEITDKEISIWLKPDTEPLVVPYKKDGKYLLGTNMETQVKVFMPFYVENNQTVHGNNTIFYKINE